MAGLQQGLNAVLHVLPHPAPSPSSNDDSEVACFVLWASTVVRHGLLRIQPQRSGLQGGREGSGLDFLGGRGSDLAAVVF